MSGVSDMGNFFKEKIEQGVGGMRGQITLPRTKEDAIRNRELFFTRLHEIGINTEEIQPILEHYGNQLIESCAGAGKTTVIVLKLLYDMITGANLKVIQYENEQGQHQALVPKRILVSTFLNTGAKEIRDSFFEWAREIGIQGVTADNIQFRTIHSEVKNALTEMGVPTPILESTDSILKKIMVELNIRNVQAKGYTPTIDEIKDVSGIVAFARNMIDHKRYTHQMMDDYKMNSMMLDLLLKRFKEERKLTYAYDYEDLQETLLEGLYMNPAVVDYINKRYDMVIVDEFQDTSQLQYEILKSYFKGKQVIAVGDSDQCIYRWRGSDIDIILKRFAEDFNPILFNLTYNYRCKSAILDMVRPSIERNTERHPKMLRSAQEGGEVHILKNANITKLVDIVNDELRNQRTVGVLARVNADLLMPSILLELDDTINYSLSKGVTLTSRLPKQIIGLMEIITKRYSDGFKSHLESLLPRMAQGEASRMKQVLSINPSMSIMSMDLNDMKQSFPYLYPILNNLRVLKEQKGDKDAYIYLLDYMYREMFMGKSTYAKNAREFITFMIALIEEHPKLKDMTLESIHHLFTSKLPTQMSARQGYQGKSVIKLTTVHEAKGKEWDTAIMWNVVQGMFPSEQPNRIITDSELEEERRVFYIGCTRGKDKLIIFTEKGRESMFLGECDLTNVGQSAPTVEGERVIFEATDGEITTNPSTEKLLMDYITEHNQKYDAGDIRNVNIKLALNVYSIEQLADMVDSKFDILVMDDNARYGIFEKLFEAMSNQVYGSQN